MKIQNVKKTFYCYVFFVSTFLHAQKRSLKKVIFKKYFFSKNYLYFKPHISESIVVSWLIQILNFSTDHSQHFRLLNCLKKWILRVVMQFFPKRKKNYRNSPIVGIAPLHPSEYASSTVQHLSCMNTIEISKRYNSNKM